MQRRFPVTVSCSNLDISAIKSQNGVVENYVFWPKNFWGEGPQNQMRTFYAPIGLGTHQVGKFGAIPPTDPDDISGPKYTRFLANFRISGVKKLLGAHPVRGTARHS